MAKNKILNTKNVIKEFDKRALERKGLARVLSDRFALHINDEFDHHSNVLIRKYFTSKTKLGNVLDAGIGIGRLAKYFSKISKNVIGVDFSNEMIGVGKDYLKKNKNITFINGDIMNSDFEKHQFDLGILSLVLKHNNDNHTRKIINKMKKWCKCILFIDHVSGENEGSKIAIIRKENEYISKFKPMKPIVIERFKRHKDHILFCIFK